MRARSRTHTRADTINRSPFSARDWSDRHPYWIVGNILLLGAQVIPASRPLLACADRLELDLARA
jgi:hypothetical protein